MWKVCSCGIVASNAKLPKKSQDNSFKICELIKVSILPLFRTRITFCDLEMS